jgi:hypothetical protein
MIRRWAMVGLQYTDLTETSALSSGKARRPAGVGGKVLR